MTLTTAALCYEERDTSWRPRRGLDGTRLASGSSDRTVRVWDPLVGEQLLRLYGHDGVIECVAFGPLGDRIVSGGIDQTLRLWNASTGAPLDVLQGHTATIWAAAWSPDGGAIASASTDGTVRIWDVDPEGIQGAGHWIYSLDVSPDNRLVATGLLLDLSNPANWYSWSVAVWGGVLIGALASCFRVLRLFAKILRTAE